MTFQRVLGQVEDKIGADMIRRALSKPQLATILPSHKLVGEETDRETSRSSPIRVG